jgi:hypothetical protein
MRQRPVAAAAVNPAMPEKKRQKPLALSPKVVSRRLASPHKIPDSLMSRVGRPHSRKLTRPMKWPRVAGPFLAAAKLEVRLLVVLYQAAKGSVCCCF